MLLKVTVPALLSNLTEGFDALELLFIVCGFPGTPDMS